MEVFHRIGDLKKQLAIHHDQNDSVGLVPTMGFLHLGHQKLLEASLADMDVTVCSIFVNPAQFNNPEDLANYPSSFDADVALLRKLNVDYIFSPASEEMYPSPPALEFTFTHFENALEGAHRPGHFGGVGLVVTKLFNIVNPKNAYFGNKDLQQLMLVKHLVKELNMDVHVVGVPTVREESGLAFSSRNSRLSVEHKEQASMLFKALKIAGKIFETSGDVERAKSAAMEEASKAVDLHIEYLEIVNPESFKTISTNSFESRSNQDAAICIAAEIGNVRLIDNVFKEKNLK